MKKYLSLAILWTLSVSMICLFFTELVVHPNSSIINLGGDAIKNYFTYLYYIGHDQGHHFSGMNYPYGEHIVFTDNMPLISGSVTGLSHWFPGIAQYGLGIMHTLLLLSIAFAVQYVYKILKHFGAGTLWAMISALFIIFFSPQVFKLYGHFGMAFLFYIPFTVYQLIRYEQKPAWRFILALFCCTIMMAFIHLYNMAIISVLIGFYVLAYLIVYRKNMLRQKVRYIIPLLLPVILSFTIVSVYLRQTDSVTDRPGYPYGALSAEVQGIDLLVAPTPLGSVFQFAFGMPDSIAATEGRSYTGVVTLLVILVLIFRIVRSKRRKEKIALAQPVQGYGIWFWVAFFHLLLAMGVPFVWARNFFAEHISALRQFRTLGRFIWPFYYLIMIYASLFIYHFSRIYQQHKKGKVAYALLGGTVLVWAVQLSSYYNYSRLVMKASPWNYEWLYASPGYGWTHWLREKGHDPETFQAAVMLPYFHVGSEKLWIMDVNESYNLSRLSALSLQTGLPLVNVMMSRTSWQQTFSTVRLFDDPMSSRPLLDSFSNKPVLILVDKTLRLKAKEQEWLQDARFIGDRDSTLAVYSVLPRNLKANNLQKRAAAKLLASAAAQTEGLLGDSSYYYVNHFDHTGYKTAFAGTGSFKPVISKDEVTLDIISLPERTNDSLYNLSVWAKCNLNNFRTPYFLLYFYDAAGQLQHKTSLPVKYSTHVSGAWFLADIDLTLLPAYRKLVITIGVDHNKDYYYALDELLLKPVRSIHYYKTPEGKLLLNNRIQ